MVGESEPVREPRTLQPLPSGYHCRSGRARPDFPFPFDWFLLISKPGEGVPSW